MPSISMMIPAVATMLLAALPVAEAGCYSSGLAFKSLHGGLNQDITQEVINDINTTCQKAAGKTIKSNEPFWLCTEWEITISDHEDCYENCIDGCNALGGGNTGEINKALCRAGCDPNCDPGPTGGYNHIDWAIEIRGDQTEKQITWDICNTAFNTERGGCQQGGQNNHDGFWFRIDPGKGKCGTGGAKVKKFIA